METYTTCNSTNTHLSKRTWFFSLCDKKMNVKSKSGPKISIFRQRRERFVFILKNYDFDTPGTNQIDNMFRNISKGCKDNIFHNFEYRCGYDIKFEHKRPGEVFNFTNLTNINYSRFKLRNCSKR